jgi:epoxyqueuosine reductase
VTLSPKLDDPAEVVQFIKLSAKQLGLSDCAITDTNLEKHEAHLLDWLDDGFHGEMDYMERHGTRRSRPADLVEGPVRIICVRLDYFPPNAEDAFTILANPARAYVSRYALGRDYHKVLRNRIQKLAKTIEEKYGSFGYRAFVDSAPVMEKALAEKAGLGWIGKHSNLLSNEAGSWFFLGELYTNLPLPVDPPMPKSHCGSCTACINACPTDAIVAPYRVDARRCISYHTIELKGSIPVEFRKAMGNRIYGCDDCQLVCPFNKFSHDTKEPDFAVRHNLDKEALINLFSWTESEFKVRMAGSPIYRIGYERWLRNIAVALGNAPTTAEVLTSLKQRVSDPSELIREHVSWALKQHSKTIST